MTSAERELEQTLIEKLRDLKYEHRPDIRDRAALEKNFREKFQALNRVRLTDDEFDRLLAGIVTPDVFAAAQTLRNRNRRLSLPRSRSCPHQPSQTQFPVATRKRTSHGHHGVSPLASWFDLTYADPSAILSTIIEQIAEGLTEFPTEFGIYHGDTLTNDWDMLRETNPAKTPTFDAVVANPPFSYRGGKGDANL